MPVISDQSKTTCTGDADTIQEGRKSFPSGHASNAFAGLGFLAVYLAGRLRAFDARGHVMKLLAVIVPLLGALLVVRITHYIIITNVQALSRVSDYRHHWQSRRRAEPHVRLCVYRRPTCVRDADRLRICVSRVSS